MKPITENYSNIEGKKKNPRKKLLRKNVYSSYNISDDRN